MTKRILVTGGAGFIGSHVAERFLEAGWAVTIADDLSSGKAENVPADAKFHELSVNSTALAKLVEHERFDVITHLAAQIDVRRSVADPIADAMTNILGTLTIAEAVRRSKHGTRIVFTSTGGAIYGDFNTPPNFETFAKDPDSPYAISKLSAEHYLAYYGRIHGVESVAVRFSNVYGPRQDPHGEAGVVAIFCGRILGDQPLVVFGDGLQTRDYVYVTDVANAVFLSATRPLPSAGRLDDRGFNIGTGCATTVLELAETLNRVAKSSSRIEFAPRRPGEQQDSSVNADKAAKVLGWKPQVSLERGLEQSYSWFAERVSGRTG